MSNVHLNETELISCVYKPRSTGLIKLCELSNKPHQNIPLRHYYKNNNEATSPAQNKIFIQNNNSEKSKQNYATLFNNNSPEVWNHQISNYQNIINSRIPNISHRSDFVSNSILKVNNINETGNLLRGGKSQNPNESRIILPNVSNSLYETEVSPSNNYYTIFQNPYSTNRKPLYIRDQNNSNLSYATSSKPSKILNYLPSSQARVIDNINYNCPRATNNITSKIINYDLNQTNHLLNNQIIDTNYNMNEDEYFNNINFINNNNNNYKTNNHNLANFKNNYNGTNSKNAEIKYKECNQRSSHKYNKNLIDNRILDQLKQLNIENETQVYGCIGLVNLGNTCYVNSILQCLIHSTPLLDLYKDNKFNTSNKKQKSNDKGLNKAFENLLKQISSCKERYVNPEEFVRQFFSLVKALDPSIQNDAQEFLMLFLQALSEELFTKSSKKKNYQSIRLLNKLDPKADNAWKKYLNYEQSPITDIFMGQGKTLTSCLVCGQSAQTFDPILGFSLPIINVKRNQTTLEDCLLDYFKNEILQGDERIKCTKCNQKTNGEKVLSIQKFPKLLIIHLKRFNNESCVSSKVQSLVSFSIEDINFNQFSSIQANVIYELYGVVNHFGTLEEGHYNAFIKVNKDNSSKWFWFDDDEVIPIDQKNVVNSNAYILFYLHKSTTIL